MDQIAQLPPEDRADLFRAASEKLRLTPASIEKDFWVCWVLRRLYVNTRVSARIHFKGGTSLSKVFHVIERMSEDVDLVIDRADLGFTDTNDPTSPGLSKNARQRIVEKIKTEAQAFIRDELQPAFARACAEALGVEASPKTWEVILADDDQDQQTILFSYPTISPPSTYLRDRVRLELGARGKPWPSLSGAIRPYAADPFPDQFDEPDTQLPRVVSAERTFWDKATILHRLHHQPEDKPPKRRMARHYYDLFQLTQHELGQKALANTDLLADVVEHTILFFPRPWAKFALAKPGSLRLTPSDHHLEHLRKDFNEMGAEMIFGDVPEFDAVITRLQEIESAINA
jgi:predicted nucleotidyltransferase component of viral defense system